MSHQHTAYHAPIDLAARREQSNRGKRPDHPRGRPDFTFSGDMRVSHAERQDRLPEISLNRVRRGTSVLYVVTVALLSTPAIALVIHFCIR